ncbi:hypothetical protein EV175_005269 [Coemansia sp. RSA 1933]|nr:hypothetical protein EV175_005269 [Coemansia sp. RSA 1933]
MESIYGHDSPVRASKIGSSAAIFPALRYLKWHSPYMFEDDLLFRGNSDTLEYLDIAFSNKLADVLERHSVFSVGRYSRLSHIRVEKRRNNSHETLSIDTYLKHVDGLISPATQLLSM